MIKELWCAKCIKYTLWFNSKKNPPFANEFECGKCKNNWLDN
jgi:hypothetical protein